MDAMELHKRIGAMETKGLFWISAMKCVEVFCKSATELATQRATEWCYEMAPGIKGFKFITLVGV
jgi:hypothetical protein